MSKIISPWTEITDNPIIVDLRGCQCLYDVHTILKQSFGFPNYYGRNWSAFWDCLWEFSSSWRNEPLEIQIVGMASLPPKTRKYCQPMYGVFQDLKQMYPNITVVWSSEA